MWRLGQTGWVSSMDDIKVQLNIVTPSTPAGCRTASPDMFHTTNKKTKHSGNKTQWKQNVSCAKKEISWGWHKPHWMTKAGTTWSNYIQIMLCFSYTMFLTWAWLDMGAYVLKVAIRWRFHPNRTIRILRECCFWISNHTITQWVQTVPVKYFKSCVPRWEQMSG